MKSIFTTVFFCLVCNALFAQVNVSGIVYNDPNNDGIVNGSGVPFSLPDDRLVAILVRVSDNRVIAASTPSSSGIFSFSAVPAGQYYTMLNTNNYALVFSSPPPLPLLETSWTWTGESTIGGTPDGTVDGRTQNFVVGSTDFTGLRFGIQERPFADDKMNNLVDKKTVSRVALGINTASAYTKGTSAILSGTDSSGGSIATYTINALPLHGTLYRGATPVVSLADVAALADTQLATLAYLPDATALSQELDMFSYYVTDNANTKSSPATYVIPFTLLDSDNDGVANQGDVDDDNDGLTDLAECDLNDIMNQYTQLISGGYTFLRPRHFGFTGPPQHRTGLRLEADISPAFGKPAGSIIVRAINANTHPSDSVFYMNDSTGATEWEISGTLGTYVVLEQGVQYFSYDKRSVTLLNGTTSRFILAQGQINPAQGKWSSGNDGYNWWLKTDTALDASPRQGQVMIALTDPGPKYFRMASTANNLDERATYFIRILPECDYDNDGLGNRADLDSDNDGCLDALEGSSSFTPASLVDAGGSVAVGMGSPASNKNLCASSACVAANGMPATAGGGQTPVGTYNPLAQAPVCIVVLPVNLLNLTAQKQQNSVLLDWTTGNNQNNRSFTIERSADSRSWSGIGTVTAARADGNTINTRFSFVDHKPLQGTNFYRLKQLDATGAAAYSATRQVTFGGNSIITISPNPTKDAVVIDRLPENATIRISDFMGRVVLQLKTINTTEKVSLSSFSAGLYYFQITGEDGTTVSQKILKQN